MSKNAQATLEGVATTDALPEAEYHPDADQADPCDCDLPGVETCAYCYIATGEGEV